jgi:hypothetical protein
MRPSLTERQGQPTDPKKTATSISPRVKKAWAVLRSRDADVLVKIDLTTQPALEPEIVVSNPKEIRH